MLTDAEPPTEGGDPTAAAHRGSLSVVYFTVFLDLLAFGILLPALPYWTRDLGGGGLGLGVVLSSYSVAQFFGSPLFGALSDRWGRRPILLLCLVGSTLSLTAVAFAPSLWLLCLARALAGLFGGSIATAQAYISDVTTRARRTRALGLLGACIGLGFVLGPAIGALVVALGYGFKGAALVAAVLALVNLGWAALRLREPSVPAHQRSQRTDRFSALRIGFQNARVARLLVANFLITGTFVSLETTFAFFGADRFGLDAVGFGMVMFGIGMILVVIQGGAIGRLSDRFDDRPIARVGVVAMSLGVLLLVPVHSLSQALPALVILAIGRGLVSPTLSSLVSKNVAESEQGAVLGGYQAMAAAARATVPLGAGLLYDVGSGWPYVAAAVMAAIAFFVLASSSAKEQLTPVVIST